TKSQLTKLPHPHRQASPTQSRVRGQLATGEAHVRSSSSASGCHGGVLECGRSDPKFVRQLHANTRAQELDNRVMVNRMPDAEHNLAGYRGTYLLRLALPVGDRVDHATLTF